MIIDGHYPVLTCLCGKVHTLLGDSVTCSCGVKLTVRKRREQVQPWAEAPNSYKLSGLKRTKPVISGWKPA